MLRSFKTEPARPVRRPPEQGRLRRGSHSRKPVPFGRVS
jgi:hypothetical protein